MIAVVGLPCGSMLLNIAVEPVGSIGFRGRTELGTSNGTFGTTGRSATMVSSRGDMRTVSFHPSSFASGRMTMLSQVTRLSSWTSNRWKWIGCVSTPLCVNRQICVPSAVVEIGVALTSAAARFVPSRSSVAGFTYG